MSDLAEQMKAPEVMVYLRISRTTLNRWIKIGKLPVSMVGGRQRFARDDVLAQIEKTTYEFPVPMPDLSALTIFPNGLSGGE